MREKNGFWFPDYETHFPKMLDKSIKKTGVNRYQWEVREFAIKSCLRKRTCIDIGSNVGLWSNELVQEFSHVIAFEPVQDSIDCFKLNVKKNNYTLYQMALGNIDSYIDMVVVHGNSGHSHINTDSIGKGSIPIKKLDSFNFKNVDLIKIDVEGYEEEILYGAESTIKENKPVLIVEQRVHEYKDASVTLPSVKILEKWGYKILEKFSKDYVLTFATDHA